MRQDNPLWMNDADGTTIFAEPRLALKVLKSLSNGVTIADARLPNMPLVYVNPAFERMTGYQLSEIRGENCRFLQRGDTDQPGLAVLRDAMADLRQPGEAQVLLRNYRKDGTLFWNELFLSPLRDAEDRVTHFAGIQNDVTLRVDFEQKLLHQVHYDALTGAANRALLLDRLQQALGRARRNRQTVALLLFDLDNFKTVNHRFGQAEGDRVLKLAAERLRRTVRDFDTVARLGSDKFVVMMADLEDGGEIPSVVRRLLHGLSQTMRIKDHDFNPSASLGVAEYPGDGATPENLLKFAEAAMYSAKHRAKRAIVKMETTSGIGLFRLGI